jgi:two-component system, NarL family, nitrate/nitrite response regulator NarL
MRRAYRIVKKTKMSEDHSKKSVVVCDTQPITAEGLRSLLAMARDLEFLASLNSLEAATQLVATRAPDIVIVDKGFGMRAVLDWIHDLKLTDATPAVTVWGVSMTEAEALRLLQAGARGIVRKTANLENILSCLRTVAEGRSWMEDCVFRDSARQERYPRSELTPREHQVLEMVEQGFKNKEIALELGIRPGTVKIHLKHIFEKTGVRGRYGLAISGLKERGLISMVS